MFEQKRDFSIDVLRGIAIFFMFFAHLAPFFPQRQDIFYDLERIFSSLAAPLFLFLVGFNFSDKSFTSTFKRIFIILFIAVFIDLIIFHVLPFSSFDILYCISFSLFFLHGIKKFNKNLLVIFILLFFLITQLLSTFYKIEIREPGFNDKYDFFEAIHHFFIDGWFPVFPWIIFPLLGRYFKLKKNQKVPLLFLNIIVFSFLFYFVLRKEYFIRSMTIEIFYPPNFEYLLLAISFIVLLWQLRPFFSMRPFYLFREFGRLSLFLYVFHLSLYYLVLVLFNLSSVNLYLLFVCIVILMFLVSYLINFTKKKWPVYQRYDFLVVFFGK